MYKTVVEMEEFERYLKTLDNMGENIHDVSKVAYVGLRQIVTNLEDFIRPHIDVNMLVTMRTDKTNEVLVDKTGKFFWDYSEQYPDKHTLDDLVLLSAKELVDDVFKALGHFDTLSIIQRSTVYPVGSLVHEGAVFVYVNLVIDHTLIEEPFFQLKDGYLLNKIQGLRTDHFSDKLKTSLALVKEE